MSNINSRGVSRSLFIASGGASMLAACSPSGTATSSLGLKTKSADTILRTKLAASASKVDISLLALDSRTRAPQSNRGLLDASTGSIVGVTENSGSFAYNSAAGLYTAPAADQLQSVMQVQQSTIGIGLSKSGLQLGLVEGPQGRSAVLFHTDGRISMRHPYTIGTITWTPPAAVAQSLARHIASYRHIDRSFLGFVGLAVSVIGLAIAAVGIAVVISPAVALVVGTGVVVGAVIAVAGFTVTLVGIAISGVDYIQSTGPAVDMDSFEASMSLEMTTAADSYFGSDDPSASDFTMDDSATTTALKRAAASFGRLTN